MAKNRTDVTKSDIPNTHAREQAIAIEYVTPSTVVKYEQNSRTHSPKQIEQLKKSITEFGFTNPILIDENSVLIAGHGRIEAATELQLWRVPAIRLTGLTEAQKRALRIADNKLPLNAGWDEELLRSEIVELSLEDYPLELLGFSADELEFYTEEIDIDSFFEEAEPKDEKKEEDPKQIKCPHCGEMIEM